MAQVVIDLIGHPSLKTAYLGETYYEPTRHFDVPANAGITSAVITYTIIKQSGTFRDRLIQFNATRANPTSPWLASGQSLDASLLTAGTNSYRIIHGAAPSHNASWQIRDVKLTLIYNEPRTTATASNGALNKTSVPGGAVTFSWTSAGGLNNPIISHHVQRSDNGGAYYDVAASIPAEAQSYAVTAPAAGSSSVFRVYAYAAHGSSDWVYSPVLQTYSAPSVSNVLLNGSSGAQYALSGGTLPLTWKASNGSFNEITSFTIQKSSNGGAYVNAYTGIDKTHRTYNVAAHTSSGNNVKYQVIAIAAKANSAAVAGPLMYTYSAPTLSTVRVASSTSHQYLSAGATTTVTWAAADGWFNSISSYTLQSRLNGGAWSTILTGLSTPTANVTASATPGNYYEYKVIAYSPRSSAIEATSSNKLYTYSLPAITAVRINGGTSTQYASSGQTNVPLTWAITNGQQNSDTGSTVEVSENGASYGGAVDISAGTRTRNTTASTTPGAFKQYRVTPKGARGNGSAVVSPRLYTYKALGKPGTPSISPTNVVGGQTVTLSWTASAAGVGVTRVRYDIYTSDGSTPIGTSTTESVSITAPANAGTYAYRVVAVASNTSYNSAYSSNSNNLVVAIPYSTFTYTGNPSSILLDNSTNLGITISPAESGLTHVVESYLTNAPTYKVSNTLAVNINTLSRALPLTWNEQIPITKETISVTTKVTTKKGASVLGSTTRTITGIMPASEKPTVTFDLTKVSFINAFTSGSSTYYLKGQTQAKLNPVFAGKYGSAIQSWNMSMSWSGGSDIIVGPNWTSIPFPVSGTVTLSVYAVDSRNRRSATKSISLTITDYSAPSFKVSEAYRVTQLGVRSNEGTYLKALANATVTSIGSNLNPITTLYFEYRLSGSTGAFSDPYTLTNNVTYSGVVGGGNISTAQSYEVRFSVKDSVVSQPIQKSFVVTPAKYLFDFHEGKAALGRIAIDANTFIIPDNWTTNIRAARADKLTTARTLTIGSTGKTFNGSANVSWSLAEIGAAASSHAHTELYTIDARSLPGGAEEFLLNPSEVPGRSTSTYFGYFPSAGGAWKGILTVKGWTGDYAAWQLIGNATNSSSSSDGLYYRTGHGTTWNTTREILHSGNYNTYAPTKTGTGASGTWAIDITGTAAKLSKFEAGDSTNAVGIDTVKSNAIRYVTGTASILGASDGAVFSQAYSAVWSTQIYQDYDTGQIALRGQNSGTWQAWRKVLDHLNFNTWAPTLTGTGASGTWGISVTGSSASLTTARTLTIGSKGKTFNGSANVSWSLAEIGALPLSGGTMTGHIFTQQQIYMANKKYLLGMSNGGSYYWLAGMDESNKVMFGDPGATSYIRSAYNVRIVRGGTEYIALDSGNYNDYAQKKITYNTTAPSGGSSGDIYIKYTN